MEDLFSAAGTCSESNRCSRVRVRAINLRLGFSHRLHAKWPLSPKHWRRCPSDQDPRGGLARTVPHWTRGGRSVWNNTTYMASESEEWTSDGRSYFYARLVDASDAHDSCVRERPANAEASSSMPHVFIARWERGCLWALHPSYECWRVTFCERGTMPGGPPPAVSSS